VRCSILQLEDYMKTRDALKLALLLVLSSAACHCFPVEPAHADSTTCTTKCRTDSGGNVICKTVCR
jgi:hypothetical protein